MVVADADSSAKELVDVAGGEGKRVDGVPVTCGLELDVLIQKLLADGGQDEVRAQALSDAEQATFFSNYGAQLQEMIVDQHEQMQEGVRRLEFLHWMARPIRELGVFIRLNRFYESEELHHFRVMAKLFNVPETDAGWYIGGTDRYQARADGEGALVGTRAICSAADPPKLAFVPTDSYVSQQGLASMYFAAALGSGNNLVAPPTPEILQGRLVMLFVTKRLASMVKSAAVVVNGYRLASWDRPTFQPWKFGPEWPEPLWDAGEDSQWVASGFFPPTIDFSRTPLKHQ